MSLRGLYWSVKYSLRSWALKHSATRTILDAKRYLIRNTRSEKKKMIACFDQGPEVAHKACKSLLDAGVDAWLCAGSLLGVVRDGDFIPWDTDLDLCIIADESFSWDVVEEALIGAGFIKIREFSCDGKVTEQAYSLGLDDELTFDLFAILPLADGMAKRYLYGRCEGVRYENASDLSVLCLDTHVPQGKTYVDVRGWRLPVPLNAEVLLEDNYGPMWRTPDPNYRDESTFYPLKDLKGRSTLHLR